MIVGFGNIAAMGNTCGRPELATRCCGLPNCQYAALVDRASAPPY
jgi:hypothetical protein